MRILFTVLVDSDITLLLASKNNANKQKQKKKGPRVA